VVKNAALRYYFAKVWLWPQSEIGMTESGGDRDAQFVPLTMAVTLLTTQGFAIVAKTVG
jgi:hypothetical protein